MLIMKKLKLRLGDVKLLLSHMIFLRNLQQLNVFISNCVSLAFNLQFDKVTLVMLPAGNEEFSIMRNIWECLMFLANKTVLHKNISAVDCDLHASCVKLTLSVIKYFSHTIIYLILCSFVIVEMTVLLLLNCSSWLL